MSTTYILIAVAVILVIMGIILAPKFAGRQRTEKLHDKFGAEYDRTVESAGSEKKAQQELDDRQKHVATLKIRPLSAKERERYLAEWSAVQADFVEHPSQATDKADQLIMEVMQLRAYPVSDFEQRAADISVDYPELVGNYRAARAIAIKNEKSQADTEELRQAMVHFGSLFKELLGTETVAELETVK